MKIKEIKECRICDSKDLKLVIDLGEQMLATITVTNENKNHYIKDLIPLEVVRCDADKNKENCGLVQLRHTYPHEKIYFEYWYRSGINQTMRDALKNVVESAYQFVNMAISRDDTKST